MHPDTPTMIGWTIGGKMLHKPSALKVTYLSATPALSGLTLESHGIWVNALDSNHPWSSYECLTHYQDEDFHAH